MTISVRLEKNSVTVVPAKLVDDALAFREQGETVNVFAERKAVIVIYPDGSTAEEIERLIDAAEAKADG